METVALQEPCNLTDNPLSSQTAPSNCEVCGGTGWAPAERDERGYIKNVRLCECKKDGRITRRIPAKYRDARLTDFKAPTVDAVETWIDDSQSPGLFLYGPSGVGKTHLAVAICRRLLESGEDVLLRPSTRFYRELRDGFNTERSEGSVMREYVTARWLLLDDVGSGALTDFERRYLLDLLDQRADRKTLLTSNLTVDDFTQRLDERIGSRLREFTYLRCAGADRRATRSRPKIVAA